MCQQLGRCWDARAGRSVLHPGWEGEAMGVRAALGWEVLTAQVFVWGE